MIGHDVLNTVMGSNDANAHTIRDYLKAQLEALYEEGEGFSGKRPLGNSGWEYELAYSLIDGGYSEIGHFDEEMGEYEVTNWDYYNELMQYAIQAL